MWLLFALFTTFSWAFADLFYKKGADSKDKLSHIKTVVMVGLVMGLHAFLYMFIKGIHFNPFNLVLYLPVSFFYILSMAIGYIGLRYIELSISSPVQNSSGMITAILVFIFFDHTLGGLEISAVLIITLGIIALAVLEKKLSNETIVLNEYEKKKYQNGFIALLFPILYCLIDGLGTFADAIYLDELSLISEDNALLAFEFTFFICAVISLIYLKSKKVKFNVFKEKDKGFAAIFETVGQFFYVFAMSKNAIIVAPLIASYSVFSVLLSRLFLKERLTKKQYIVITFVLIGIALLALSEIL